MTEDLLDLLIGWLFTAVTIALASMAIAAATQPTPPALPPTPVAEVVEDTPAPSLAEGLGRLGYLPCDTPTGPHLPSYWTGDGGPYVIDTLGGHIPLEVDQ